MALSGEGCDVTVFTLDRSGAQDIDGVRLIGCDIPDQSRIGRLRKWAAIRHAAAPMRFRKAVFVSMRQGPLTSSRRPIWDAPASLLTGKHGFALVTRNSTPAAWSRQAELPVRDRLDAAAADLLERKQAGSSAGLISNTEEHGRRIVDLYKIDAQIPHRTIGLSLPPELLQTAQSSPYPSGNGHVKILFVGRAEQRKGFAELIDAVEILAAEVAAGTVAVSC